MLDFSETEKGENHLMVLDATYIFFSKVKIYEEV